MNTIPRFWTIVTLLVIALHAVAAFTPTHYNWGFHYFAFYPAGLALVILVAALLLYIQRVRAAALSSLSTASGLFSKLPTPIFLLVVSAVWLVLMTSFPAKLHLLGDSDLILLLTPKLPSIEDVSANFRNQPLTYQSLRMIQTLLGAGNAVEPLNLFRIADAVCGIAFLLMVIYFLKKLRLNPLDAILIAAVLLFTAGTQFFFGYVENYMFFFVAVNAYLITGWLALENKLHIVIPLACLLLMIGFHIASVILLPSVFLLLIPKWRTHKRLFGIGFALLVAAGVGAVFLGWIDIGIWTQRLRDALRNDILPLTTPANGQPYGIFSGAHLIDWVNANLHIVPFGIVGVGALLLRKRSGADLTTPLFLFLGGTALIGLVATLTIPPGLGMARDWDMLANFFVPLQFLLVFLFIEFLKEKSARHVLLLVVGISILRWIGWIGINAGEERHLARAEVLTAPELNGTFPKIYYETLAKTFFKRDDFRKAARWYETYMTIDSMHPRIVANLADCYNKLGDQENYIRMLQRSVDVGSTNPGVYSNLSLAYASRGDTAGAISLLSEALRFDPSFSTAHANLSIMNMGIHEYAAARLHAKEALRLGRSEPILYKVAGYSSYFMRDYPNALLFLNAYLKLAPADAEATKILKDAGQGHGVE